MGKLTVRALRVVLALVLAGTVFVQGFTLWALVAEVTRKTDRSRCPHFG